MLLIVQTFIGASLNNPYNPSAADLFAPAGDVATYQPKVFTMNGRIGRVRYIAYSMALLMTLVVSLLVIGGLVALATGGSQGALAAVLILFYIVYIAGLFIMTIRRAHDMGHSGWMSLLMLVPLVSLWFLFAPGTPSTNEYGPKPVPNTTGVIMAAFSPIVFFMVMGILAAIAMPAYQAYMGKAKAAAEQAQVQAETAPAEPN